MRPYGPLRGRDHELSTALAGIRRTRTHGASGVLLISGDNDGLNKVELMKTYQLLGGGISADMAPMPKSHLAIVPNQTHVGLMMQSQTILGYLNDFLK